MIKSRPDFLFNLLALVLIEEIVNAGVSSINKFSFFKSSLEDKILLKSVFERLPVLIFSDEISESSPNNLVANCSEDISKEKKRTFLLFSNSFDIFEAILVANAVLPIDGLPAIIIKSDL